MRFWDFKTQKNPSFANGMNNIRIRSSVVLCLLTSYGVLTFTVFYAINWKFSTSEQLESVPLQTIQIWSKASIGYFLWQHIFNGSLVESENKFFIRGTHSDRGFVFEFYSGPGYIQTTLPSNVTHLVLILNGHTSKDVQTSRLWLEFLPRLIRLKNVAVVILGNEKCQNDWILKHMKKFGGVIDVLFMVYDSVMIDNRDIFQWPLGVSTYRNFPTGQSLNLDFSDKRKYKCNFFGTVYKNSSRQELMKIISSEGFKSKCLISSRDKWAPRETVKSLTNYINALKHSDFTLCPVGFNTECYRIYEALSFGSIPIVEDVMTKGKCSSPLRALKRYDPPFLFIKNWTDLDSLLLSFNTADILALRRAVVDWYSRFKISTKNKFISVIKEKFKFDDNDQTVQTI